MSAPVFPRIWDLGGERKIIGETRVSWLVESGYSWVLPIKVSKKTPNGTECWHRWFFSEADRADRIYVTENGRRILSKLDLSFPNGITADQLRQIAATIGYKEPGGAA